MFYHAPMKAMALFLVLALATSGILTPYIHPAPARALPVAAFTATEAEPAIRAIARTTHCGQQSGCAEQPAHGCQNCPAVIAATIQPPHRDNPQAGREDGAMPAQTVLWARLKPPIA